MANSGGVKGSVSITSTAGGSDVTVTYPADPGPPPQVAHTDIYTNCVDWALRRFEHAMPPLYVAVTVDANGNPTSVKV